MFHVGYPPTLCNITGDKDIVVNFVKALMVHRMKYVSVGLQRCFIDNILRHWKRLISVIQSEPQGNQSYL